MYLKSLSGKFIWEKGEKKQNTHTVSKWCNFVKGRETDQNNQTLFSRYVTDVENQCEHIQSMSTLWQLFHIWIGSIYREHENEQGFGNVGEVWSTTWTEKHSQTIFSYSGKMETKDCAAVPLTNTVLRATEGHLSIKTEILFAFVKTWHYFCHFKKNPVGSSILQSRGDKISENLRTPKAPLN